MGALIFVHDAVRAWLKEGLIDCRTGKQGSGKPREALPLVTFNGTVTFHLNGEEVHVFKAPNAQTDGDSIVHFAGSTLGGEDRQDGHLSPERQTGRNHYEQCVRMGSTN